SGNTVFITTAGGGVWKTINAYDANVQWTPLTDSITDQSGNPIPLFTGSIAIQQSNPDVIYVGTGESNQASIGFPLIYAGRGLLKSTDGGQNWTLFTGNTATLSNAFDRREISRVIIDPTDPTGNTVFVATTNEAINALVGNMGVYKTTDGGVTWTNLTAGKI